MTVEAIRLQNFVAFEDTGWIELRPITLLFGRNSSGKSAIIRALRLLKQSLDTPASAGPFVFESRQGVDLGSFKDIVHGGSVTGRVWFSFRCCDSAIRDALSAYLTKEKRNDMKPGDTLEIALGYEAHRSDDGSPDGGQIEAFDLQIWQVGDNRSERSLLLQVTLWEPQDRPQPDEYWLVEGLLRRGRGAKSWIGFGCLPGRGFLPDFVQFKQSSPCTDCLTKLYSILISDVSAFLNNIIHLGPVRPEPQRRYSFSRDTEIRWREQGWGAFLDFIGGNLPNIQGEVNHWLGSLQLGEKAEPHLISLTGALFPEYEIGITENGAPQSLPLSAMGFGASQVLPVIVQSASASAGSLVIVEQPELHLHPAAQAELTDLFIDSIRHEFWDKLQQWKQESKRAQEAGDPLPKKPSTDVSASKNPRFLIETHSEHLLLRLRLRIAESSTGRIQVEGSGHLPQDSLRAYFIYRPETSSFIKPLSIGPLGQLGSPQQFRGFFTTDLEELGKLNRVMLESHQAEDPT